MDVFDATTRSRNMAAIRSANTKPEMLLRRALHSQGYRYRLHRAGLPGRPDLVLAGRRVVIFVHGCFWHRHQECRFATTPATRPEFWQSKLDSNVNRDARSVEALVGMGWRVATVWECQLQRGAQDETIKRLTSWLDGGGEKFELPPPAHAQRRTS
ncbi:very short patch repair endonuclease [Limimaricola variabilis]